jgi:DNA-binding NtrC family response regulator
MIKKAAATSRIAPLQRIVSYPVRVLVVDDEDAQRTQIATLLDESGYDVMQANGIETALASLQEPWAEVLVLDMHMPNAAGEADRAGLVVLEALAGREICPGVVVLTAEPASPNARAATNLGAAAVLDKAHDLDKLPEQVCNAWFRKKPACDAIGA